MSRISFVPVAEWPKALRSFSGAEGARDIELGITRMLAHAPAAAMGPLQFGAALVSNRTLPERLIELLRLRIAFHNQCRSCMAIRYQRAAADVCSLETPSQADQLNDKERLAIELGDRFACDHLSIDDAFFTELKDEFTEAEVMELLMHCALYVGVGRLAAVLDMTEELPAGFAQPFGSDHIVSPSSDAPVLVR